MHLYLQIIWFLQHSSYMVEHLEKYLFVFLIN